MRKPAAKSARESFMVGWRTAYVDRFVCVGCGYTESFVADPRMLERIERKWPLALSDPQAKLSF